MNTADNAWRKFAQSGKAQDYITYRRAFRAENSIDSGRREEKNASGSRRAGYQGTEYR